MNTELASAIVKGIVRLVFDWPMAVILIRLWVWGGVFELCRLPTPTLRQSIGIAALLILIAP